MLSIPSALLVTRLKWLRLQQSQDGSKPEPVTRSRMYSDSTITIYLEQCTEKINNKL